MKKIALDFEVIFSPYTMAAALAALHSGAVSEIFVPSTARFIEVWNHPNLPRPITLDLEKDDDRIFVGLSRLFGSSVDVVDAADPFAGLLLLRKAIRDGAVTQLDPSKHHKEVVATFAQNRAFSDFYRKKTPTGEVILNPDFGTATLEGLIGWGLSEGISPVFGDHDFLVHFATVAASVKLGNLVSEVPDDPILSKLVSLPIVPSADALYKFAADKDFRSIASALIKTRGTTQQAQHSRSEILIEIGALAVDHGTHTIFAGGASILYKVWKSFFKKE